MGADYPSAADEPSHARLVTKLAVNKLRIPRRANLVPMVIPRLPCALGPKSQPHRYRGFEESEESPSPSSTRSRPGVGVHLWVLRSGDSSEALGSMPRQ